MDWNWKTPDSLKRYDQNEPLVSKKTPHMTNEELCLMIHGMFNMPKVPLTDLPENKEFMEEACDAWGNSGEPIQPEDCDTWLDEQDVKRELGE